VRVSEGRKRENAGSVGRAKRSGAAVALLGLVATLLAPPAWAGKYFVEGVGTVKCSDFTDDADANASSYKEEQQWIVGFISGYNNALVEDNKDSNIGNDTDFDATMKLVYNYCTQYPDDELTDAAHGLMDYFKGGGK
jgi:hypothetical protein